MSEISFVRCRPAQTLSDTAKGSVIKMKVVVTGEACGSYIIIYILLLHYISLLKLCGLFFHVKSKIFFTNLINLFAPILSLLLILLITVLKFKSLHIF